MGLCAGGWSIYANGIFERFRVSVAKQTLSRELRAMGYRKLSARPRHLELIAWLLDQLFATEAFEEVIVTHKTDGRGDKSFSWVTWGTRDRDSGLGTAFDPREDVPVDPDAPVHDRLATRTLGTHTGFKVAHELGMPGDLSPKFPPVLGRVSALGRDWIGMHRGRHQ